jgi:hypothetical protein
MKIELGFVNGRKISTMTTGQTSARRRIASKHGDRTKS